MAFRVDLIWLVLHVIVKALLTTSKCTDRLVRIESWDGSPLCKPLRTFWRVKKTHHDGVLGRPQNVRHAGNLPPREVIDYTTSMITYEDSLVSSYVIN